MGSTPVGRTRNFFFRECLCHSLKKYHSQYTTCWENVVHFLGVPQYTGQYTLVKQSSVDRISIWRYHFYNYPGCQRFFFSLWGRRNWAAKLWKCDQHTSLSTLLVAGEREDLWHPGYLTTWHFLDLANQCNKFTSNIKPSPSCTKFKLTLYQMSILWAFPLIFLPFVFRTVVHKWSEIVRKYLNAPHISVYTRKTNSWYGNRLKWNIFKE